MPIVRMPDGKNVRFPDDMPKEEIKAMISSKFPEFGKKTLTPSQEQIEQNKKRWDEYNNKSHLDGVATAALMGFGEGIESGVNKALDGATLGGYGWLDRHLLDGTVERKQQEIKDAAEREELGEALAVSNLASEIGGNAYGGGGAIAKKITGKGIKGLKSLLLNNTAQGLGYGATSSDSMEDLPSNLLGNVTMANILGLGTIAGAKGANALYNSLRPYANASQNAVSQAVDKIGLGKLKELANKAQKTGRSILEVGDEDIVALAQDARQQSPKAYKNFEKAIDSIREGQAERNSSMIDDVFGSRGKYENTDDIVKFTRKKAQPLYDKLQNVGDLSKINPKIEQEVALNPFLRKEVTSVLSDPLYQAEYGTTKMPLTDWRVLDQANRSINDKISAAVRAGETDKVRLLERQKEQLLNMVDEVVPEYKAARGIYEAQHKALRAQKIGEDALFDKNTSAQKLSRTMKDMTEYEKQSLRIGAKEKLLNAIESKENQTLGLKNLKNKQTQAKLKLVLGDKANDFINYAEDEVNAMRNVNKLTGGSQTSEKQNIRDKLGLLARIFKNPTGVIGEIGDSINSRVVDARGDILSKMLTEQGGNRLGNSFGEYLRRANRAQQLRGIIPSVVGATTSDILKLD